MVSEQYGTQLVNVSEVEHGQWREAWMVMVGHQEGTCWLIVLHCWLVVVV